MQSFSAIIKSLLQDNVGKGKKFQNYRRLAEVVGTSHTTFTFLTQNRIKNPNPDLLRRISQALMGDEQYLLRIFAEKRFGFPVMELAEEKAVYRAWHSSGHMLNESASRVEMAVETETAERFGIPILSQSFETDPGLVVGAHAPAWTGPVLSVATSQQPAFAVLMEGDAMSPRYLDGDCLVASPTAALATGKPVLFKAAGRRVECRLWKDMDALHVFIPVNPSSEMLTLPKSQVQWIYPVHMVCRFEK